MIETQHPSIYTCARNLALKVLESLIKHKPSRDGTAHNELVLWVDGITLDTLPSFCKLLDATQKMTVQHAVVISNAWQEYHPPSSMYNNIQEESFTPILTIALASIVSEPNHFSESFITFICQVTTMTLMQQFDPMLLATVVRFLCTETTVQDDTDTASAEFGALLKYSEAVVKRDKNLAKKANYLLGILFGKTSIQFKVSEFLVDKSVDQNKIDDICLDEIYGINTPITAPAILRQAIHHSRLDLDDKVVKTKLNNIILKLLPILIQVRDAVSLNKLDSINFSLKHLSNYVGLKPFHRNTTTVNSWK